MFIYEAYSIYILIYKYPKTLNSLKPNRYSHPNPYPKYSTGSSGSLYGNRQTQQSC